jgi:hypothetical protein
LRSLLLKEHQLNKGARRFLQVANIQLSLEAYIELEIFYLIFLGVIYLLCRFIDQILRHNSQMSKFIAPQAIKGKWLGELAILFSIHKLQKIPTER